MEPAITIFALPQAHVFPRPELADDSGLLAVGGDLHPRRVLLAYSQGIFPWYDEGGPILWHSPDPRFVLRLDELHLGRTLRQRLRKQPFELSCDRAFGEVMRACGEAPRPGQRGTWITDDMLRSYVELYEAGFAHSVEAWRGDELVGGLYGVSLGSIFFGESMFTRTSDASKIALVTLVTQLRRWGFEWLDSQVYTDHIARFGAAEIPRTSYLDILGQCMEDPTRRGPWRLDDDLKRGAPPP